MWHVHNSASSGGEDGGVLGLVFGGLGDRESNWLAGGSVKGTRIKRLRELKRKR